MSNRFVIEGRDYDVPSMFRALDPVLVRDVTGMEWDEFAEGMEHPTPVTTAGLVAVAIWQGNPTWRRDRVVRFMEQLDLAGIEVVDEGDAVPPTEEPQPEGSESSDAAFAGGSDFPSDSTLPSTGILSSGVSAT